MYITSTLSAWVYASTDRAWKLSHSIKICVGPFVSSLTVLLSSQTSTGSSCLHCSTTSSFLSSQTSPYRFCFFVLASSLSSSLIRERSSVSLDIKKAYYGGKTLKYAMRDSAIKKGGAISYDCWNHTQSSHEDRKRQGEINSSFLIFKTWIGNLIVYDFSSVIVSKKYHIQELCDYCKDTYQRSYTCIKARISVFLNLRSLRFPNLTVCILQSLSQLLRVFVWHQRTFAACQIVR